MSQQKPTTRSSDPINLENKSKEPVGTPFDQERGETDTGRSQGIVDQVISALIVEKLITIFPTTG